MLKLKLNLQYFGHLMQRANSLEKTLMLGKIEGRRREDKMVGWHHWLNGHEFEQTLGSGEGQGRLACGSPWGLKRVSHNLVTEQQQRWKAFKISFVGGGVLSGGHDQWHIDIVKEQESVNSGYLWRVKLLWFSFSSGKHITCAVFRAFFRNCWRSLKIF